MTDAAGLDGLVERLRRLANESQWPSLNQAADALTTLAAENATLRAQLAERDAAGVREALADMLAGWRYIRLHHGDLNGVGWDRAQFAAEAALSTPPPTTTAAEGPGLERAAVYIEGISVESGCEDGSDPMGIVAFLTDLANQIRALAANAGGA